MVQQHQGDEAAAAVQEDAAGPRQRRSGDATGLSERPEAAGGQPPSDRERRERKLRVRKRRKRSGTASPARPNQSRRRRQKKQTWTKTTLSKKRQSGRHPPRSRGSRQEGRARSKKSLSRDRCANLGPIQESHLYSLSGSTLERPPCAGRVGERRAGEENPVPGGTGRTSSLLRPSSAQLTRRCSTLAEEQARQGCTGGPERQRAERSEAKTAGPSILSIATGRSQVRPG